MIRIAAPRCRPYAPRRDTARGTVRASGGGTRGETRRANLSMPSQIFSAKQGDPVRSRLPSVHVASEQVTSKNGSAANVSPLLVGLNPRREFSEPWCVGRGEHFQ